MSLEVTTDARNEFKEFAESSKKGFILFNVQGAKLVVTKKAVNDSSDSLNELKAALPTNEGSFAAIKVGFQAEGGVLPIKAFITCVPNGASVKSKMIYSSSSDHIISELNQKVPNQHWAKFRIEEPSTLDEIALLKQ